MNKPTDIMNAALVSRGMLPMDGHCFCGSCMRDDLNRDDMDGIFCKVCIEDAKEYGKYSVQERSHTTISTGMYDYARGKVVFDHG